MLKQWMTALALVLLAAPAVAQAPRQSEAEQVRARQRISTMEGVLEKAVMSGADNLVRQVDSVMPNAAMLSGAPRVRGFRLDSYGVFFDVEVPALRLSFAWTVRSIQSAPRVATAALNDLRIMQARMTDRADRERIAQIIQQLELALGPTAQPPRQPLRPGGVSATALAPAASAAAAAPAAAAPPENPNEVWTHEVKTALIDAMLEYGGSLAIGDDEWLAVAARDNLPSDPLIPGESVDFSTVVFRIKGRDLAALQARRLTLDEARQRVDVREN
jgi:hypothetical protein